MCNKNQMFMLSFIYQQSNIIYMYICIYVYMYIMGKSDDVRIYIKLQLQYILTTMAFLARQNKQQAQQQPNRGFGRGLFGEADLAKAEQKNSQQELYKQQLQRQILQKQQRKKKQLDKIRREDQKFIREIEEINRKDKQRNQGDKQKRQKKFEQSTPPAITKKQQNFKQNKANRGMSGNLNIALRQLPQWNPTQVPKPAFQINYQQIENNLASNQKRRHYLYEQNQQINTYYEQRIKKHKDQMNQKLDQLFYHINSTKDNIKADEQIEKIRKRLRSKQTPSLNQLNVGQSRLQLDFQNKFFNIPKKNNQIYYRTPNEDKSRVLDYQSRSKFTGYKNIEKPQTKVRTQNDDLYGLPQANYEEDSRVQKWGNKPGRDNFLSNRQAIDFEAESILGKIDDYLGKLKS